MSELEIANRNYAIARFMDHKLFKEVESEPVLPENPTEKQLRDYKYDLESLHCLGNHFFIQGYKTGFVKPLVLPYLTSWDWLMPVIQKIWKMEKYPIELHPGQWILERLNLKLEGIFLVVYLVEADGWSKTRKIFESSCTDPTNSLLSCYWQVISSFCLSWLKEDTEAKIDAWHKDDTSIPLHTYLGMTLEQYGNWVKDPNQYISVYQNGGDMD